MITEWELLSHCPVCESAFIEALPVQKGKYRLPELDTVYFKCESCFVEFQNPRLNNIDDFYSEGHYRNMLGQSIVRVSDEGQRRAERIIGFLAGRAQCVKSFLDFGSAAGDLIDLVGKTYNAESLGIEIDKKLAVYANAKGRHTTDRIIGSNYDLVAMAHTLEHLSWPTRRLQEIKKVMTPAGRIYIEVPNGTYVDAHVISFSTISLSRCAELAGFKVLELFEQAGDLVFWGGIP
jgi:SAM-dependent methyltransferase